MDLISKKDLEQQQKAGDNSTQIMVSGNVNVGVTEQQARDICKAECAIALQNWAFQAGAFAEARIQKLEDRRDKIMIEAVSQHQSELVAGKSKLAQKYREALERRYADLVQEKQKNATPYINEEIRHLENLAKQAKLTLK